MVKDMRERDKEKSAVTIDMDSHSVDNKIMELQIGHKRERWIKFTNPNRVTTVGKTITETKIALPMENMNHFAIVCKSNPHQNKNRGYQQRQRHSRQQSNEKIRKTTPDKTGEISN